MAEAAVAALGLASSILGLVGFAGQILQGCNYISNLFDDIQDAPDSLRHLGAKVKTFRIVLHNFQGALKSMGPSANLNAVSEQVLTALNSSSTTIQDLKGLIDKYMHDGKRDWWKDFKVAAKKNAFAKYGERLESDKINILLAQSSIIMIINSSQHVEMQQLLHSMNLLQANSSTCTTTFTSISNKIGDSHHATHEVANAISILRSSMLERLDTLPFAIGAVFKSSLESSFQDCIHDLTQFEKMPNPSSLTFAAQNSLFNSSTDHNVTRIPRRHAPFQQKYVRKITLGFATIKILSVTTSQDVDDPSNAHSECKSKTITTRTRVDMRFPIWMMKLGLLLLNSHRFSASILGYSGIRLRVYRLVPTNAPIVQECFSGDLASVYNLFTTGSASPHDLVLSTDGSSVTTLLDIAWNSWFMTIRKINKAPPTQSITRDLWRLNNEYEFFSFLVFNGLDPGEQRIVRFGCVPRIWELVNEACSSRPALIPYLIDMARLIISRATINPFESTTNVYQKLIAASLSSLPEFCGLVHYQESWPLPEAKECGGVEALNDARFQEELFTIGCSGRMFGQSPYSLIRDAEASYFREFLNQFSGLVGNWARGSALYVLFCLSREDVSQILSEDRHDYAIQQRIIACLDSGIEFPLLPVALPQDWALSLWTTLVEHFNSVGKLEILREALLRTGRDPGLVDDLLEKAARDILEKSYRISPEATEFKEKSWFLDQVVALFGLSKSCHSQGDIGISSNKDKNNARRELRITFGHITPCHDSEGDMRQMDRSAICHQLCKTRKLFRRGIAQAKAASRMRLWEFMVEPRRSSGSPLFVRNGLHRGQAVGILPRINELV